MTQENTRGEIMSNRSYVLARRLELGALALEAFANSLTEAEWQTRVPGDERKIGVIVHHVASAYPIEIKLAETLANGQPIEGVTCDVVNQMNAQHAKDNDAVGKEATLEPVSYTHLTLPTSDLV